MQKTKLQKFSIFTLNGLNFLWIEYDFKKLNFLIDTGATVSVISKKCLSGDEKIYDEYVRVEGIAGCISTCGTVNLTLNLIGN